ncbi:MAG: PTS sugar transporter subunit IIB [Micropruina sp.]|nr:PTS sugar transporter subunit IIB [Micropruina sp.]
MKVLLVCAAGMSTSLLTNAMMKSAQPGDAVEAFPISELLSEIDRFDVVLLGPQIKFKLKDVEDIAKPKGIPVAVIDMRVYGMMNGPAAMEQARSLLP